MENAYSTLEELRDEVQEVVDNMSEKLSQTPRYETLEETVNTLNEVVDDQQDWPSSLDTDVSGTITVTYYEDRSRKVSRATRRDNAANAMAAAVDGMREWTGERQLALDTVTADLTDEQKALLDGVDTDELAQQISDLNELADKLEEQKETAEGAEFPGMYG